MCCRQPAGLRRHLDESRSVRALGQLERGEPQCASWRGPITNDAREHSTPSFLSECNTPGWKNQFMVDQPTASTEETADRDNAIQPGRRRRGVDPADGQLPQLLWPKSLVERPERPLVCYLDLNHWIGLSRANAGRADGERYVEALAACRAAKRSGAAVFPISDAHYVEMAKIRSESQRAHLAEVMWELSGLTTILSRPSIMRMELDRSLSDLVGPTDGLLAPLPLLGFGSAWAFGRVGWRLRSDEEDLTDELDGDALRASVCSPPQRSGGSWRGPKTMKSQRSRRKAGIPMRGCAWPSSERLRKLNKRSDLTMARSGGEAESGTSSSPESSSLSCLTCCSTH